MKRATKMILFIAVAAVTFGSLNHFIGHGHCGGDFRNQHRYESPLRETKPPAANPATGI